VGTDGKRDIPIPENVRCYYIPSTTHGGGRGGFDQNPPRTPVVNCPGNNYGQGTLRANPVPHSETVNAIRVHFRNWVMNGAPPPPSLYPTLRGTPKLAREDDHGADDDRDAMDDDRDAMDDDRDARNDQHHGKPSGFLVGPTKTAMGFPDGIPELPASEPEAATITSLDGVSLASPIRELPFINPVLDYEWGPFFHPSDGSGVPTSQPPPIKQVIKMLVPRVDADANELGGVPVVLRDAPLGSYFGWNITATTPAGWCPSPRRAPSGRQPVIRGSPSRNATATTTATSAR
jgi:Alpha/beta hydrolase domain